LPLEKEIEAKGWEMGSGDGLIAVYPVDYMIKMRTKETINFLEIKKS